MTLEEQPSKTTDQPVADEGDERTDRAFRIGTAAISARVGDSPDVEHPIVELDARSPTTGSMSSLPSLLWEPPPSAGNTSTNRSHPRMVSSEVDEAGVTRILRILDAALALVLENCNDEDDDDGDNEDRPVRDSPGFPNARDTSHYERQ